MILCGGADKLGRRRAASELFYTAGGTRPNRFEFLRSGVVSCTLVAIREQKHRHILVQPSRRLLRFAFRLLVGVVGCHAEFHPCGQQRLVSGRGCNIVVIELLGRCGVHSIVAAQS